MNQLDFTGLIQGVEDASPFELPAVLKHYLETEVGALDATFWIADYSGYTLERVDGAKGRRAVNIVGSAHGRALRTQAVEVTDEERESRVYVPVTARGEAIGVIEILTAEIIGEDEVAYFKALGHAFAYIVVGTRRHTDLFEWGQRSKRLNVAAEIQRRLLPAFTCECENFTVAGWVEPATEAGGDTFDYTVDGPSVQVSLTDAMGHGIDAALLATLAVGVTRNERRSSAPLVQQVTAANRVLCERSSEDEYVTGIFLDIPIVGGAATLVSAGHPAPWRIRDGEVQQLDVKQSHPLGMFEDASYEVQAIDFLPGDRLLLISDGVVETLEQTGRTFETIVSDTIYLHPREAVQFVTSTVVAGQAGMLRDDATAVCIDLLPEGVTRHSAGGADVSRASAR